ncbi:uncharacterized protein THITE_2111773 [Thermothielavioides terrestris NRRL 8126]|uniref:Major facilitator superfamily (MFS) profile domain-containing protein n=1 Tax=Thermothielavioides terrestris (strain ATCC 38088 / NRRL 8126) TaxID=578455 RepID=G2R3L5_THETT|nr:uncharacterized protein THITE_2111773 [Thermothielavioides terrestris NRRL 8126]AEO65115.1 hypothetical protein THITE_2111773 [Thermothielavioides terrestris NRRL 8126]
MPKNSVLSSETELQDGIYELTSRAAAPVSARTDEADAKSTKTMATVGGAAPLLGTSKAASASDGPVQAGNLEDHYPEGGIRAWLVVLGCWLALFTSLGFMHILATFQAYLSPAQQIQLRPGPVAGAIFGYASLSLLLGIYVGPLFDKYGPRWLILAGTVCSVASLLFVSIGTEDWQLFVALGILSSLGSAFLFTPAIAAVGHFFKDRRGFATGVATTACSASAVVFPFILQALFVRVGWAWAMRALALICFAITVAANFLIRARLPAARDANPHPHGRVFRTKGFAATVLAVVLAQFASFLPLSYMSSYALSKGFSEADSFNTVAILNASSLVGRVVGGWSADKIGPFNVSAMLSAIAALACFGIWLPAGGTKAGITIFAVIFGCASGSSVSLVPVSVGRLCKTQEYGRYYGACYTVASLVSLFAIPAAEGVLREDLGSYWALIVVTGMFYVAAAATFVATKLTVTGWRIWAAF